ncbi:MAG: DUF3667 domain-containing protein [Flavobacteriales bacterium]|nr:DUF3667 domain-containing protein [Flavobacteriales bacterium]
MEPKPKNTFLPSSDVCRTCGSPQIEAYCAQCGQRTLEHRFNLKDSFQWIISKIFDLEHGFFHTTWLLLKSPGTVPLDYLKGATVNYTHPFRFMFIWATLSTLVSHWIGAFEIVGEQFAPMEGSDPEAQRAVQEYMFKYLHLVILATVPFMTFWNLLFFRKSRMNFTEHLIINAYGLGASTATGVVFFFMYYLPFAGMWITGASMIIMMIVIGRIYSKSYQQNVYLCMLKYLLIYLLSMVSLMIIAVIVTVAWKLIEASVAG